ncbi:adenylate/guanylate cyclase catalytic domain protein [Cooperia oncophora]
MVDVKPALLHLIKDCWAEHASERPPIAHVKQLLKSMHSDKNENLMDYAFNILEKYASSLEEEVELRMKELWRRKRRATSYSIECSQSNIAVIVSQLISYTVEPWAASVFLNLEHFRQVADQLKLGQSVEPEVYESATVFFSDVVSFTVIAAKGSPLQVVNLLNSVYTLFDGIIDEHDVYKVETIGDAYLCVSGVPRRNGHDHIKEICSMSLGFMHSLIGFHIPHLPDEQLRLRIGIHTGSVVAGVVGLSMPRYCLFGDTVNTASRMESNGKRERYNLQLSISYLSHFTARNFSMRGIFSLSGQCL